MKFTRKPVAVEAMQFAGTQDSFQSIVKWANLYGTFSLLIQDIGPLFIELTNRDGIYKVSTNSWIIKNSPTDFQTMTNDVFVANFDPVK